MSGFGCGALFVVIIPDLRLKCSQYCVPQLVRRLSLLKWLGLRRLNHRRTSACVYEAHGAEPAQTCH
jgi:hypothetical protein